MMEVAESLLVMMTMPDGNTLLRHVRSIDPEAELLDKEQHVVGTQTEAIASKAHGQHWGADPQHVCGLQLQEALRQCCSQTDVNSRGRPGIRRCEQDWNYQVQ